MYRKSLPAAYGPTSPLAIQYYQVQYLRSMEQVQGPQPIAHVKNDGKQQMKRPSAELSWLFNNQDSNSTSNSNRYHSYHGGTTNSQQATGEGEDSLDNSRPTQRKDSGRGGLSSQKRYLQDQKEETGQWQRLRTMVEDNGWGQRLRTTVPARSSRIRRTGPGWLQGMKLKPVTIAQEDSGRQLWYQAISSNCCSGLVWHRRCSEIKSGHWLLEAQDGMSALPCSLPLQVVCFVLVLWLLNRDHWVKGGLQSFLFGFFGIVQSFLLGSAKLKRLSIVLCTSWIERNR